MSEPILLDRRQPTQPESEGPWWIKFATAFGVPALLAVYFAWSIVSGQNVILNNIERMLYAQQTQVSEIVSISRESAIAAAATSLRIEAYMRQICVNSADTPVERNTCLSVR